MDQRVADAQRLLWDIEALRQQRGTSREIQPKLRQMARLHEELADELLQALNPDGWIDLYAAITVWGHAGSSDDATRLIQQGYELAALFPNGQNNVEQQLKELENWLPSIDATSRSSEDHEAVVEPAPTEFVAEPEFGWDVYLGPISPHNRLARAMVHQWRDQGLRVFYDEDTILRGEELVTARDRARGISRHRVVMITPEAIAKKWVDDEIKAVTLRARDKMQGRLIPVQLEPVAESTIPPSVWMLNPIDLTNPETRPWNYQDLLESLGIKSGAPREFPVLETAKVDLAVAARKRPVLEAGAMPTDSPYYIEREVERSIHQLLENPGSTITIKGYRQSGKSSLLARLLARAVEDDRACCILDFQGLDATTFQATKEFFPALARALADGLNLDADPGAGWSPRRGAKQNLTNFLEKQVLAVLDRPVLLLFDKADLTFPYPAVREELFSTLRFWHNQRANTLKQKTWKRLGLIVAHSTEPSLWIEDLNQSPFNVGTEVLLDDLDETEVAQMDAMYEGKLRRKGDIKGLMELVGGHPYLVRLALYTMATEPCSFATLKRVISDQDGPLSSHLGHLWNILHNDNSLLAAVRKILESGKCNDEFLFQRLWSVGLIRGETRERVWLRYKVYDDYFRRNLL